MTIGRQSVARRQKARCLRRIGEALAVSRARTAATAHRESSHVCTPSPAGTSSSRRTVRARDDASVKGPRYSAGALAV